MVAFFLTENAGSESAAARACIQASRAIREALVDVAARSDLAAEDLVMRFGLHWGATLYVGQITTSGRAEITALGDEVNEGARIEACATGGRALASKELLERLDAEDAAALGLDPDHITYTPRRIRLRASAKLRRAVRAGAWSAVLLVDDLYAVGGVHDRLVLLVPSHPVVLVPGLAQNLEDLPPASGLAVNSPGLEHVADARRLWCVVRAHARD